MPEGLLSSKRQNIVIRSFIGPVSFLQHVQLLLTFVGTELIDIGYCGSPK